MVTWGWQDLGSWSVGGGWTRAEISGVVGVGSLHQQAGPPSPSATQVP